MKYGCLENGIIPAKLAYNPDEDISDDHYVLTIRNIGMHLNQRVVHRWSISESIKTLDL